MGKFSVQVIVFLQVTCYAYILGLTGKLWLRSGSHRGSFKQTLSTVIDTDTASTKNIIVKSTDAAMIASPGVYARVSTDRWWGELFCAHRNHGIRWFVPLWTVEQYGGNVLPHFQVLKTQSRSSYDIDSGLSRVRHRFNLTDAEYNLWQAELGEMLLMMSIVARSENSIPMRTFIERKVAYLTDNFELMEKVLWSPQLQTRFAGIAGGIGSRPLKVYCIHDGERYDAYNFAEVVVEEEEDVGDDVNDPC